jgi:hypothetical protein
VTDRFVCSDASSARGEAVTATASQVRGWLLVEVHGAWGTDAITDSHLGAHVPKGWAADLERRGIRPICIRPAVRGEEPATIRAFFVVAHRPGRTEGAIWSRTAPLAAIRYLSQDLDLGSEPRGWDRHDERVVLVCTNGRHDQCCANRGRPVLRHLRTTKWLEQVWECSHIGGDRFAANVVVLPDSLYFGRMEPAEAEALLDAHAEGQVALEWFRGRTTLKFVEQAAEHAVRTTYGVRGVDDVVIERVADTDHVRAEVRGVGSVEVALERSIEVCEEPLTCHGSPNQRVPRYVVTDIRPLGTD